jgi:hypothetical protein
MVPALARHGLNRAPGSVAHRKGTATRFVPPRKGRTAPLATVVGAAADPDALSSIAVGAVFTVRAWDAETERVDLKDGLSRQELQRLQPDELIEVRRPPSYVGKSNYAGRMPVPTVAHSSRGVWFESFNEMYHYRDLLITRPVAQMSSQPMEITWQFPQGMRTHIPDCVFQSATGERVLVDVTTKERLDDPRARAIFRLSDATASALNWKYELRTELPAQHQRNISFLWAYRSASDEQVREWLRRLDRARLPQQIHGLARVLHDQELPVPVWSLLALGHLSADLSKRLAPDTVVSRGPNQGVRPSWLVTP